MALSSLGLALTTGVASAHVAVIRNSAKLQGNDTATIRPAQGNTPVRVTTQRGVGMTTRQSGNKTVITFDRPVLAAGTYFDASGNQVQNASIQAYDRSGRPLKLWDEGTRRLQVTQWTRITPGGNAKRTFMGVRSCCACIKQVVLTRPQTAPFQVAVYSRQPEQLAPRPRIASRTPSPLAYSAPVTPPPAALVPPTPAPAAITPPVVIPAGVSGGGGGGFPFILPLLIPRGGGGGDTTIIRDITPSIPPLPPGEIIPEPSAIALALPGLLPLLALRRWRRKPESELEDEEA